MSLRRIPLEAITQSDLQRLIEEQVAERRDIDYKQETYGNRNQDYGEFLADVSSFANTAGGEIVIGMTEQAGVPTGFSPLQVDADDEILRLENVARSGLTADFRICCLRSADRGRRIRLGAPHSAKL